MKKLPSTSPARMQRRRRSGSPGKDSQAVQPAHNEPALPGTRFNEECARFKQYLRDRGYLI